MRTLSLVVLSVFLVGPAGELPGQRGKGRKEPFTGKWSTNFGPIVLTQKGKEVEGTYGYTEQKISGTVAKRAFTYEFKGGEGTLTLDDDNRFMRGKYTSDRGPGGFLGGYRIEPARAKARPGKITTGQTKSWLNYHLRVPRGYKKSKKYPAIAFLHGSNMTSKAYVNTLAARWPKLAKDYILVGFDGENLSSGSSPGRPAYNFSYVNFSGHEVGEKGRYRQSPALVAEALDELRGQLPITKWFVGGHSQGGFLTYAVYMFYPDKVAGVFPMSCNLLVQCAPDYFKDAAIRAKQREVAIAVIHGENDPVVKFSGGEWCYRSMVDGGFPMVRFFKHLTAAHMFAHLPVEKAVRWLEALSSDDPVTLLSWADESLEGGRFRDACAAVHRIEHLGVPNDLRRNVKKLVDKITEKAKPEAARLAKAIKRNRNNQWVDAFLKFREEFAFAKAAAGTMKVYETLRNKHKKSADDLFYAARGLRDDAAREAKYQEIVDKYYASKWYQTVKGRLDD
jgi:poly(3-hydroxybutyrate) depolymerase